MSYGHAVVAWLLSLLLYITALSVGPLVLVYGGLGFSGVGFFILIVNTLRKAKS